MTEGASLAPLHNNMTYITFSDLEPPQQSLLLRAEEVMKNAYSPYSRFSAGAALLADDGSIHVGTNLENAVFDLTIHAEAAALSAANTSGIRRLALLAVIGKPRDGLALEPVTPCGICRQNLYEFAELHARDLTIICSNTNKDKILVISLSQLLPHAFGPKQVGVDLESYQA